MSNEVIEQLPSPEDARRWVDEVKHGLSNVRHYLLKIRDTKAYLALGYDSFEALGKAEFGYEKAYLHQLSNAALIEKSLNLSAIADYQIPETHLRPLTQIPEEARQAIWDEANRAAEAAGKERTAKMVEEAVRMYKQQLVNYEDTIDELNTVIDDFKFNNDLDKLKASHARQIKEQTELLNAIKEQRDRILEDNNQRIKGLEKALTEAQGEAAKAALRAQIESEKITDHNAELNQMQQQIEHARNQLDRIKQEHQTLKAKYDMAIRSEQALEKVNRHLQALSLDLQAFFDVLGESREVLDDQHVEHWKAFERNYWQGASVVKSLVGGLNTVKLSVVS